MWIHVYKDWPNFTWQENVVNNKLSDVRYKQGRLLGRMEKLGFELKREASLTMLTFDVVKSTSIEGEKLNTEEVRSSIARRLGINIGGLIPASRDVEGIVELMLDATQRFLQPLTKERLCSWHAALFPTARSGMHKITVGAWRTLSSGPMQVISGPIGHEKIHFEAPSADRIEMEMQAFLQWFENTDNVALTLTSDITRYCNIDAVMKSTITRLWEIDPVLKAGIAHLWFVTIHPFEDGNGRIARAIGDMALARADSISERFYSLSSQIEAKRSEYYKQLEKQQNSVPEITNWLLWFLDCLERAIVSAEKTLDHVLLKDNLWSKINQHSLNERQRLIINRMLEVNFQGFMNTSKYAKLAKCSTDTALRDIQTLKSQGIFIQNVGSGRSTSYKLFNRI